MSEFTGANFVLKRALVARRFAKALAAGAVELHYQPIVSLKDGSIAAAEALIRWRTVDGWLAPHSFLPYLQGRRDSLRLQGFVVGTAIGQARAWERSGRGIQVTVNVSPRYVDPALVDQVSRALRETGLTPGLLHLELTELDDDAWTAERATALQDLRSLGTSISIDDFGQGESSLARLVHLPLDVVKIDRSFIAAMGEDRKSAGVVKSATALAHMLEMSAVGEGVETVGQWHALREFGCDYAQGFLISRPLPSERLMPALANSVIPMLDRLAQVPATVERRVGASDRRAGAHDRRKRGADLWPRPLERRARR